jgi:26S proteasome regulatory subunit N3
MNLLLHNYQSFSQYEKSELLCDRRNRLQPFCSVQLYYHYLYYNGRAKAIKLAYKDSFEHLTEALQIAPETAKTFRVKVWKWLLIVQLLRGKLPNHFRLSKDNEELRPYNTITQAMQRIASRRFVFNMTKQFEKFIEDQTWMVVSRLRFSVLALSLCHISISYSRIYLDNVVDLLAVNLEQDEEFIVAKHIRNNVLNAQINHQQRLVLYSHTNFHEQPIKINQLLRKQIIPSVCIT